MMHKLRQILREQHGQSLLEFALLVPVLLLLICGMIDFGRLLYTYLHLNIVVQEAVRLGGLGGSDTEIMHYIQTHVHTGIDTLAVRITPEPIYREAGDYITVALEQPVRFITPVVSSLMSDPIVAVDSTIRIE
jgi:Flp pilus assembly protein TadG